MSESRRRTRAGLIPLDIAGIRRAVWREQGHRQSGAGDSKYRWALHLDLVLLF
jgi:hypothetical protein